jgi:ParB-like chromosome segregation protein Spo0J
MSADNRSTSEQLSASQDSSHSQQERAGNRRHADQHDTSDSAVSTSVHSAEEHEQRMIRGGRLVEHMPPHQDANDASGNNSDADVDSNEQQQRQRQQHQHRERRQDRSRAHKRSDSGSKASTVKGMRHISIKETSTSIIQSSRRLSQLHWRFHFPQNLANFLSAFHIML